MSFNIVSFVFKHLDLDTMGKIAHALGLDRTLTEKAILATVPAILGGIASKSAQPQGARQLGDILGKHDRSHLGRLGELVGGSHKQAVVDSGNGVLGQLLGGPATQALSGAIANYAGIGGPQSSNLMGMLTPVIMGSLGEHQHAHHLDAGGVATMLAGQKGMIDAALPDGFASLLGGPQWLDKINMSAIQDEPGKGVAASVREAVQGRMPDVSGGITDAARATVGQVSNAAGTVGSGVGPVAGKISSVVAGVGAVEAARQAAGSVTGTDATRNVAGRAEGANDDVSMPRRSWGHRFKRLLNRPSDVDVSVPRSAAVSPPAVATTGVRAVETRISDAIPSVTGAVARTTVAGPAAVETARPVSGRVGTGVSGSIPTLDVDDVPRPRMGWWRWAVPLALVLLGGVWWMKSLANKAQDAAQMERVRVEMVAKAAADAEAVRVAAAVKAKADAEAEAVRVAAAAKAKAEADAEAVRVAAAAKAKADAEAETARLAALEKAKADADAEAMRVASAAKIKAETEAETDRQAILARAKSNADAAAETTRMAAAAKAKADAEAAAAEVERQAILARAKANADAAAQTTKLSAEAQAKADADAAAAKAKAEADAAAEQARLAAAAKAKADAESARMAAEATMKAEIAACQASVNTAAAAGKIQFETASASLTAASATVISGLAAAIKACPTTRLRVEGHTDNEGTPERNLKLSDRRAKAIAAALTTAGVDATQLDAAGMGETKPIAPNDTSENKSKNRRIEFVVGQR